MKASVIIPTKNPGAIFREVLPMVLAQETDFPYELLVIDSGSRDGTIEFIKQHSMVKLHSIEPAEFGHGKTRNQAIAMTSGEFIAMLTHDARPYDVHWLQNLVNSMTRDPNVAGSFGRHIAYNNATPFVKRDLNAHFDHFREQGFLYKIEDQQRYQQDISYQQFLHFFSDNNACLRRSIWEKIPYPDVDFAEDQLWAKMIMEAGYEKAYADNAIVYHSHRFGPLENFRRSFDESYAFLRLFGYHCGPSIRHVMRQTYQLTKHDARYAKQILKSPIKSFYWTVRALFDNMARQSGNYMGQRALRVPRWLRNKISRDQALKQKG